MGIMKQDTNDIELIYRNDRRTSAINALCRPAGNEFGVVGIQIAGLDMRLNVLVKDLGGIPRYFHLDHAEIPISPHLTNTKSLIRVLLNLRNVMIVNKSLITQALLEKPTSTPDNSIIKYTKPSCPDVECLIDVESTLVRCHLDSHNVCVTSNRHLFDVISMFT
ncbi:hypothetical protein GLOIN_2v1487228 [Rhizophagus irregularis DAOM 181602=DAOM 197198]|nr:hypothetical protein GLOIN_2v1487228 [Rhizophagus irregularis DAOM 181602=DAOM 197198]